MKMKNVSKVYDNLPFLGLLFFLLVIYIANVHQVEKKIRSINKLHKELEASKREYYSIKQKSWYDGTLNQIAKDVPELKLDKRISVPVKIKRTNA